MHSLFTHRPCPPRHALQTERPSFRNKVFFGQIFWLDFCFNLSSYYILHSPWPELSWEIETNFWYLLKLPYVILHLSLLLFSVFTLSQAQLISVLVTLFPHSLSLSLSGFLSHTHPLALASNYAAMQKINEFMNLYQCLSVCLSLCLSLTWIKK